MSKLRSHTDHAQPSTGEPPPPVAIVVSRYNTRITDRLLEGAQAAYAVRGGHKNELRVIPAPGTYELPALSLAAAKTGVYQGVLALGCLIKGDTRHDEYIANAVANGLVNVTLATDIPVAFGVLTVNTLDQAFARAGGEHGNKGEEAMLALLDTIAQIQSLRSSSKAAAQ